jgi:hypothetical protein
LSGWPARAPRRAAPQTADRFGWKLALLPRLPCGGLDLAALAVLAACGGSDSASTNAAPSTTGNPSTTAPPTPTTTTTGAETTPLGGSCDETAVRDAIANSDALDPSLRFEFTYLRCAEGFGWATISVEHGDSATVLFKGSGSDVELLNLGSSVCTTDAGIPADVAAQLAPDPRYPLGAARERTAPPPNDKPSHLRS